MEKLDFSIEINATKEKVWKIMLEQESYKKWIKPFSEESRYVGVWQEGQYITFYDPPMGGTKVFLMVVKTFDNILFKHVAMISPDLEEDTDSKVAKKWIGTIEEYSLNEENSVTELTITIETHEDFVQMFHDAWPKALKLLKELCEE